MQDKQDRSDKFTWKDGDIEITPPTPQRPAGFDDEVLEMMLTYLDDLRASGVTNMFGASPYLEREFALEPATAQQVLVYWMRMFESRKGE